MEGGGQWGRCEGVMLVTGECREGDGTERLPLDHQQTLKQMKIQHMIIREREEDLQVRIVSYRRIF